MFEITQEPNYGDLKNGESKINIGSTFKPGEGLTPEKQLAMIHLNITLF